MDFAAVPGAVGNAPASRDTIRTAGDRLPAEMPEDYATLLALADGIAADHFLLYSCEELAERNATYEVGRYAPGFVAVGDDGGGTAVVLRGGPGRSPVFVVGHGSMQPADTVTVADSLPAWIAAGCPTDVDSGRA